jgi:hypothetical protein
MVSMLTATTFIALAAGFGHDRHVEGEMGSLTFLATLIGFAVLTVGGWLGGSIVYVHGMRVLNLAEEPTQRAVTPGQAEKEAAEGS